MTVAIDIPTNAQALVLDELNRRIALAMGFPKIGVASNIGIQAPLALRITTSQTRVRRHPSTLGRWCLETPPGVLAVLNAIIAAIQARIAANDATLADADYSLNGLPAPVTLDATWTTVTVGQTVNQ